MENFGGDGEQDVSRTGIVGAGGSSMTQVQEFGRSAAILPPAEVKFDGGNMFEWSKMVDLAIYGCQVGRPPH